MTETEQPKTKQERILPSEKQLGRANFLALYWETPLNLLIHDIRGINTPLLEEFLADSVHPDNLTLSDYLCKDLPRKLHFPEVKIALTHFNSIIRPILHNFHEICPKPEDLTSNNPKLNWIRWGDFIPYAGTIIRERKSESQNDKIRAILEGKPYLNDIRETYPTHRVPQKRTDVVVGRQNADPITQSATEAFSNCIDGIAALLDEHQTEKIGQYGLGIKQIFALLQPGEGTITVFDKPVNGPLKILRGCKGFDNQVYVQYLPASEADTANFPNAHGVRIIAENIHLSDEQVHLIQERLRHRFPYVPEAETFCNGQKMNRELIDVDPTAATSRPAGKIEIIVNNTFLSITDNGAAMDDEKLFKMFLPNAGKGYQLVSQEEAIHYARTRAAARFLRMEEDQELPKILFSRGREVIFEVEIPANRLNLADADILLQLGRILKTSEGRDSFEIDENFVVAVPILVENTLGRTDLNNEQKVAFLNSLVFALDVLVGQQTSEGDETESIAIYLFRQAKAAIRKTTAPFLRQLHESYHFLPNLQIYSRIVQDKVLYIDPYLLTELSSTPSKLLQQEGYRQIHQHEGLTVSAGWQVFTAELNHTIVGANLFLWVQDQYKLAEVRDHLRECLSAVLDPERRIVFLDQKVWTAISTHPDPVKRQFLREAIQAILNEKVVTTYEKEDPRRIFVTEPTITIKDSPEKPNANNQERQRLSDIEERIIWNSGHDIRTVFADNALIHFNPSGRMSVMDSKTGRVVSTFHIRQLEGKRLLAQQVIEDRIILLCADTTILTLTTKGQVLSQKQIRPQVPDTLQRPMSFATKNYVIDQEGNIIGGDFTDVSMAVFDAEGKKVETWLKDLPGMQFDFNCQLNQHTAVFVQDGEGTHYSLTYVEPDSNNVNEDKNIKVDFPHQSDQAPRLFNYNNDYYVVTIENSLPDLPYAFHNIREPYKQHVNVEDYGAFTGPILTEAKILDHEEMPLSFSTSFFLDFLKRQKDELESDKSDKNLEDSESLFSNSERFRPNSFNSFFHRGEYKQKTSPRSPKELVIRKITPNSGALTFIEVGRGQLPQFSSSLENVLMNQQTGHLLLNFQPGHHSIWKADNNHFNHFTQRNMLLSAEESSLGNLGDILNHMKELFDDDQSIRYNEEVLGDLPQQARFYLGYTPFDHRFEDISSRHKSLGLIFAQMAVDSPEFQTQFEGIWTSLKQYFADAKVPFEKQQTYKERFLRNFSFLMRNELTDKRIFMLAFLADNPQVLIDLMPQNGEIFWKFFDETNLLEDKEVLIQVFEQLLIGVQPDQQEILFTQISRLRQKEKMYARFLFLARQAIATDKFAEVLMSLRQNPHSHENWLESGELKGYLLFLTNNAEIIRTVETNPEILRAARELLPPMPLELLVYLRSELGLTSESEMREYINQSGGVAQLLNTLDLSITANEILIATKGQAVEPGVANRELMQNAFDAIGSAQRETGKVVMDYYYRNQGHEFVKKFSDNGTGMLNILDALAPGFSSKTALEQTAQSRGFFGTGLYKAFDDQDRIEIFTVIETEGTKKERRLFLKGIRNENGNVFRYEQESYIEGTVDQRRETGTTLYLVKNTENILPELEAILDKNTLINMAGLSLDSRISGQTTEFFFVNEEAQEEKVEFPVELLQAHPTQDGQVIYTVQSPLAPSMSSKGLRMSALRQSNVEYLQDVHPALQYIFDEKKVSFVLPGHNWGLIKDRSRLANEKHHLPEITGIAASEAIRLVTDQLLQDVTYHFYAKISQDLLSRMNHQDLFNSQVGQRARLIAVKVQNAKPLSPEDIRFLNTSDPENIPLLLTIAQVEKDVPGGKDSLLRRFAAVQREAGQKVTLKTTSNSSTVFSDDPLLKSELERLTNIAKSTKRSNKIIDRFDAQLNNRHLDPNSIPHLESLEAKARQEKEMEYFRIYFASIGFEEVYIINDQEYKQMGTFKGKRLYLNGKLFENASATRKKLEIIIHENSHIFEARVAGVNQAEWDLLDMGKKESILTHQQMDGPFAWFYLLSAELHIRHLLAELPA